MAYGVPDQTPAPAKTQSKSATKATQPKPPVKAINAAVTGQSSSAPPPTANAVPIVPATYSNIPLGLRYTVRKKEGDQITEVPPDTQFHSGEHIQLTLEVNDSGYLYIVQQGTSGKWEALFPSADIANGDNRVQRGRVYNLPPGRVFTFSGEPGVERLFVIFSRTPAHEIDSLIYSLKGAERPPAAAAEPEKEQPAEQLLSASAEPIDDSEVSEIRETYSRDLIIEKGDQEQPAQNAASQQRDHAVYVVNPKGSADSRVVADIPLTHK
jgi:hypothetical protein